MRTALTICRRVVFVLLVLVAGSIVALAQTETLRFDELPFQPVNGLTFRGATFTFTVGGVGSTDANYGSGGPGQSTFIQDPSLEGDAAGTLTIAFADQTSVLSFGITRSTDVPLSPGATVQLFDAGGNLVQTTVLNLAVLVFFPEAQFNYSGAPIRRAVITFNDPAAAPRFVIDNLTYQSGPLGGPGLAMPASSEVSDQKAGSVLVFNIYSSSPANPSTSNTRFTITNTDEDLGVLVHLFFVEGSTCSITDRYICLTRSQTLSFTAVDQDPGTTGYLVAIAVNANGCPINFNHLIGDEYTKFETGEFANLGAEAFAAISAVPAVCSGSSTTATIAFDGINYNRVPRVLAVSNIASRVDGTVTRVVINRIGGSLVTSAGSIGNLFGVLYDDQEQSHSFQLPSPVCQRVGFLDDTFPRTTPHFSEVIPAGQTGWMKIWTTSDVGILGAAIANSGNPQASGSRFNSGHNLHKLTLTSDAYVMPIFQPGC